MGEFIKLNDSWQEVSNVYKKINDMWVQQNNISSCIDQLSIYFYNSAQIDITITFEISGPTLYTGKSFLLSALYNNQIVVPLWSIISGSAYASINTNGKVTIEEGADNDLIIVQAIFQGLTITKNITVSYDNQLTIECANTITGTSGNAIAKYNSTVITPVWSITSGTEYATIDNSGDLTILDSGNVTIQATYNNYTATKQIAVIYDAGTTTETTVDEDGNVTTETTSTSTDPQTGETTTTTTSVTTNEDGSSSTTETEVIENQDGSSSTTSTTTNSDGSSTETSTTISAPDPETGAVTTESSETITNSDGTSSATESITIDNQDGSSSSSSTTTNFDENGDTTGSTANQSTHNTDGSSQSITTNYDAEGDPTTGSTNNIDTSGNSHTQDVEYDENGDTTVTGYTVDTSGNSNGSQTLSGNEVDTQYYAFDTTHAFELMIHFKFDFSLQTESQATILNAKRASPEPWYGFDIRRNSSNMQYGVCFYGSHKVNGTSKSSGTTTRASITKNSNNIYKIKINYDPTVAEGETTFTMYDMIRNTTIVTATGRFPDLPELKYLDIVIGCNVDANGNPQRRAIMDVYEFYVRRL